MSAAATTFSQSFFHGTRADLRPGHMISIGYPSNLAADRRYLKYTSRARWIRRFGVLSWPQVKNRGASMSSSRPAPGSMIRTLQTINFRETQPSHIDRETLSTYQSSARWDDETGNGLRSAQLGCREIADQQRD